MGLEKSDYLFTAFPHPVHPMVRLSVGPVSGKVSGHGINLAFDPVQSHLNPVQSHLNPFQPVFDPVNLLTQHLMSLDNDIQLVLKIFRHHANMMLKHILDFFKIISFHMNLPQTFSLVKMNKAAPSAQS